MSDPSDPDGNPLTPDGPNQNYTFNEIENILVLGLDRRSDGGVTRSDTIMIATVDSKNDSLKLTSLMRDIYVSIPGRRNNKLNTAYAFGGVELTMETVNENFNLDIKKYIVLDFSAFEEIIDAVGGISLELTRSEARAINRNLDDRAKIDGSSPRQYYIQDAGVHTLNGRQALAFARIRDIGNDDFDRVERQQIVLSKLFDKAKTLNPLRFPSLLSAVLPYVETNFTAFEMLSLGTTALSFKDKQIHRFRLPVNGAFSPQTVRGGASALVLDFDKNNRLFHEFLNSDPVD
jgi:LCP family protein required for cell wall assembly